LRPTYPLSSRFTGCCKRLTASLGFVSLNTGERFFSLAGISGINRVGI
jgi:hypothetical protein